eukprot:GFYU01022573.1.p1 GENE.GFYU01022573.1~~GFYU01022573.1.p1  ORF type:complete len:175 (-),score=18.98 GFYU01022573.1:12-467(-)
MASSSPRESLKRHLHTQDSGCDTPATCTCAKATKRTKRSKPEGVLKTSPCRSPHLSSKAITSYKKTYKGGGELDWHFEVFKATQAHADATRVLYAGSEKHVTASMIWRHVHYVDLNKKMSDILLDMKLHQYVREHCVYPDADNSSITFSTE